jgi:hypothetical protein
MLSSSKKTPYKLKHLKLTKMVNLGPKMMTT